MCCVNYPPSLCIRHGLEDSYGSCPLAELELMGTDRQEYPKHATGFQHPTRTCHLTTRCPTPRKDPPHPTSNKNLPPRDKISKIQQEPDITPGCSCIPGSLIIWLSRTSTLRREPHRNCTFQHQQLRPYRVQCSTPCGLTRPRFDDLNTATFRLTTRSPQPRTSVNFNLPPHSIVSDSYPGQPQSRSLSLSLIQSIDPTSRSLRGAYILGIKQLF